MDLKCTWETFHRDGMDGEGEGGKESTRQGKEVGYCRFTVFSLRLMNGLGGKDFFLFL